MSVGAALANERRLVPALAEGPPYAAPASRIAASPAPAFSLAPLRAFLARRVVTATLISLVGVAIAASIPAMTALASSLRDGAPAYGPPTTLRAAAGIAGNWEASNALAAPPATELGNAIVAGAAAQHQARLEAALVALAQAAEAQKAASAAAAAAPVVAAVAEPARAFSLNSASGFAPGTVLQARITIYGCSGPGGGFCYRMSSGGAPFPGAVACSDNLPFGTKLRIAGDPTGRVYECLDRGRLAPTWIDVYFDNTSDGMAWQSSLGTTVANIEIVN